MTNKEFRSVLARGARRFRCTILSRTSLRVLSFAAVLVGLLAFALAPGQPVSAAGPWTVNTTSDTHAANPAVSPNDGGGNISLRSAIEAANAQGGTTTINVPPGTYTLSLGELQIGPSGNINVTINGTGNPSSTVIQQTNTGCPSISTCNNRVFNLDPNLVGNVTVTIQHVTIAHGRTSDSIGGAGIIAGCEVPGCGGFDSTTVNDVVFNDNNVLGTSPGAVGGGIQNIGGTLIVQNSTFTNNSAGVFRGGGIYYDSHSPSVGTFTVSNSTFTGNTSGSTASGGGAIYMTAVAGSTLSVTGSSFSGNQATGTSAGGGAIYKDGGATLTIDHSTFVNNQVLGNDPTTNLASGGAIDTNTGSVTVSFSRFVGNSVVVAGHGGAIFNAAGATTTAQNNWWGCNTGPGGAGCDTVGGTVSSNPWIVLSNTASPSTILVNQSTTLTASFLQNSAGTPLSAGQVSVLVGLPVTWGNAQLGTLSGQQAMIQSNGTAVATFTAASTVGTGHADATVDNGTATANITIKDTPITGLQAANSSPTRVGSSTAFTATISDGSNVNYAWNFGDGPATASGATTSHIYISVGFYTARVTATNSVSTVVATTPVTITNLPPIANAGPDQTVQINTLVTLDGSGSSDPDGHYPLSYGWTQTGGTAVVLSSNVISMPTFTAPATPTVLSFRLVITDAHGLPSLTASTVAITVSNQSIVGLVASNSSPTLIGNPTVFTATASGNNIVYTWNFGDSTPVADGNAVTHTYGTFGTFTAVVTATNSGGSVTATTQVTINPVRVFLPFVASNYSSALSALHVGGVLTLTMTDAYF
jgi:hypothetical protein